MLTVKYFQFSPIQENTYVVYNEFNECAIIDPGCYYDEEKEMLKTFILDQALKPVVLLNTHCHLDHVFGNAFVAETYDLKLQFHEAEQLVFDYAPVSGLQYNLPFTNYAGDIIYLQPEGIIKLGNDELKILLTPGHSPGSVSFYSAASKFVLSGDALFQRSIGRTDLPMGNHDQLLKSIKEKLFTLPAETIVYSGHGMPTSIEDEKENNPFFN